MKRSKLFLGVTTCLLAVAGVAATKVARFNTVTAGYIPAAGGCVKVLAQPCTIGDAGLGDCLYVTTNGNAIPLYTAIGASPKCSRKYFLDNEGQ